MSSPRFTYRLRPECVCGAALPTNTPVIVRDEAWGRVSFRQCRACLSFMQSPEIEPQSLGAWFDSVEYQGSAQGGGAGYHNYLADEDARLSEAQMRFLRDMAPFLPAQGRVFEIGCATGSVLEIARQHGHQASGVDLASSFVAFGRERYGLDLHLGEFLALRLPEAQFDLIAILGTMSNLAEPLAQLQHAARMLKSGGVVLINLPLADSLVARLYGEKFWMFTPSVNTFYARKGIIALLERAGFELIALRADVQRPSFGKLAHHLKIPFLSRLVKALGLGETRLPFHLPLPGIVRVHAKKG